MRAKKSPQGDFVLLARDFSRRATHARKGLLIRPSTPRVNACARDISTHLKAIPPGAPSELVFQSPFAGSGETMLESKMQHGLKPACVL
jgi:hypothetical protein